MLAIQSWDIGFIGWERHKVAWQKVLRYNSAPCGHLTTMTTATAFERPMGLTP